ncbi:hypothetical protein ZIOFF_018703 [Zingiber officinale]|uniref:DUF4216 domain-containing protein n=1 Tax=Zingiber officinale TaxID=94328 RepID=A0A8J5LMB3_ZINOF|nr:hypothetical protein ZIOFF_018703 [Zingiber officinale]
MSTFNAALLFESELEEHGAPPTGSLGDVAVNIEELPLPYPLMLVVPVSLGELGEPLRIHRKRNDDLEDGLLEGRPISKGKEKILEDHVLQAAHRYILFNSAEVEPYLQMHIDELKQTNRRFSSRIQWLAHGPRKHVISYTGYIINGYRFHTIDVERCDWANPGTGIKIEDGFTLVNLHQGLKTFESDPFILASQAKQVFYSRDNDESNWSLHSFKKMSKMVKKRGKGSVAEIQENITNKLSRMDSNNSTNSSKDLHGKEPIANEKIDKKKGRGASKLKMVSGQDKCKELERNEFGQSIGDNSVKYASFLGCMIKEFVPYTLDGWSDIDEEVKDRMWSCL